MSPSLTLAKPSASAASATATATVTDTLRRSSICGSSDAPGWRTVTRLDTALAAAANMPALILLARETIAPSARPGDSMALFAWPMTYVTPSRGDRAAGGDQPPPVSPGKQIGRVRRGPSCRMAQREDDRPLRVCSHFPDDRFRETAADCRRADQHGRFHPADYLGQSHAVSVPIMLPGVAFGGRTGVRRLIVVQLTVHVGRQQAMAVYTPEAPGRILFGEALAHHGVAKLVGNSNPCRTGAEDDHSLVAQRHSADAHGGDGRRQRDGTGALHIVVENADPVAVLLEDPPSIARRKILPLQQRVGEQLCRDSDVSVDEGVVAISAYTGVPVPDVHGIAEQTLAVSSGCLNPAVLRLPHRVLHLLYDVAEFDSGQALRVCGLRDGHRHSHQITHLSGGVSWNA